MRIKLIAKTRKAKTILGKWGETWEILDNQKYDVLVASIKDVGEINIDKRSGLPESARWINTKSDVDFAINHL